MDYLTMYIPAGTIGAGRPACARCGAAYGLHGSILLSRAARATLAARGQLPCPHPFRVDSLAVAQRALDRAEASGDASRIFAARGDLQRLQGRGRAE
jgi:hypothetical protein